MPPVYTLPHDLLALKNKKHCDRLAMPGSQPQKLSQEEP
jgi:hypothetical protein